ncbi:MAG TPA: PilZ domain-containing protein [Candidatus Aquilonibacter sp.]|nr:PilZ domain-containing protein [Candidatus Aquilonibacter sp.]
MEGQSEPVGIAQTCEDHPCHEGSCGETAVAKIDMREFCLDHFLSVSLQDIRAHYAGLKSQPYDAIAMSSFREVTSIWAREAERLIEEGRVDQAMKARLLEAVAWISQAAKSLRRSPRVPMTIGVWLRREDSRRTWEEDTWTRTVSRHGAGFVCRHPVDLGGRLVITRKDKAMRAEARVVYSRLNAEGGREIGVELIDRENFWE